MLLAYRYSFFQDLQREITLHFEKVILLLIVLLLRRLTWCSGAGELGQNGDKTTTTKWSS